MTLPETPPPGKARLGASPSKSAACSARVARIERSEMRERASNSQHRSRISLALNPGYSWLNPGYSWLSYTSRLTALSCQRRSMRCDSNDSAK
jgi:hypothetical protein